MPDTSPPPEGFGFLLTDAVRVIRRRFERRGAELGISSSQWRLLVQLKRSGPMPQARLAELLEIEPISVSRMADRMQDAGWITRYADQTDRRVKILDLSDKTRAAFADLRCIADDIYSDAFRGVTPEAFATTKDTLHRLIANLSEPTETRNDD